MRGITSWSLETFGGENVAYGRRDFSRRQNRGVRNILGGERLKSPDRFPLIRATASYGCKRIGVLLECSRAERKQNDNLLIPYAH